MIDEQLLGHSLNERHRSFNKLIAQATSEQLVNGEQGNQTSSANQLFNVAVARKFLNKEHLCSLLKSDNRMVFKNALKADWFFSGETTEKFVNVEYFFTYIFPDTCYQNVIKIIVALSTHLKNPEEAERFYIRLLAIYGSNVAERMLKACPEEFVRKIIMEEFYEVKVSQLLHLYKKFPTLSIEYLDKCFKRQNSEKQHSMLKFDHTKYEPLYILLACEHPKTFLRLYNEYKMRVSLGYRTTVIILNAGLEIILSNFKMYIDILCVEAVLDNVKKERFDMLIKSMLPSQCKNFNLDQSVLKYLKRMKPTFRVRYLIRIYSELYDRASLLDDDKFINLDLVRYLPREEMNAWAMKKIDNLLSEDSLKEDYYLKFTSTEITVPRIKNLLASTSKMEEIVKLMETMLDSCKHNADEAALLNVMIFVAERYRNAVEFIRYRFMFYLKESFVLHKLSAKHWEVINEMLQIMYINNDIEKNYRSHFLSSYLQEYIHYRLDHNEEIDSVLEIMQAYNINTLNLLKNNSKYELKILNIYLERYRVLIESRPPNDKRSEGMIISLLKSYFSWNERYKNRYRNFTDNIWLLDQIKKWMVVASEDDKRSSPILEFLKRDRRSRSMFANELFKYEGSSELIRDLFKHDATIITDNSHILVEHVIKNYTVDDNKRLFQQTRAYMQKPFGDLFKEKLIERLGLEKSDGKTIAAIISTLFMVLDKTEAELMVVKYAPNPTKIVTRSENVFEYQMAEVIANSLKFINPPISYDALLMYGEDDYLKFALKSLLSLCYKRSTVETINFIDNLAKKQVSLRKHSARLAYFLYPRNELLKFFKTMWAAETNSSVRDAIFQRTFSVFQSERNVNRARDVWQLLKFFILSFEEKDKNLFQYLVKYDCVYPEIVSDYLETCWKSLSTLKVARLDVSREISYLLWSMSFSVHLLSSEFCDSIIHEYLNNLDLESTNAAYLQILLVYYLVKANSLEVQNRRVEHVCSIFKQFILDNWNMQIEGKYKTREIIKSFTYECCSQVLNYKPEVNPQYIIISISDMLKAVLPFEATFSLHVMLQVTLIYLNVLDLPDFIDLPNERTFDCQEIKLPPLFCQLTEIFGEKVAAHMDGVVDNYGLEIHQLYCRALEKFVMKLAVYCMDCYSWKLRFLAGLLRNEPSTQCRLLALELMPDRLEHDACYTQIIDLLLHNAKPGFKMVFAGRFEMPSSFF